MTASLIENALQACRRKSDRSSVPTVERRRTAGGPHSRKLWLSGLRRSLARTMIEPIATILLPNSVALAGTNQNRV